MNWNDIQVWSLSVDWLNIVLTFAFLVLPTLLIFAVSALFGAGAVRSFKQLLVALRPYINDPTDAFIKELEEATGVPGTFWNNLFIGIIDGVLNQPERDISEWSMRHWGEYGTTQEAIPPVEAPPQEVLVG